MLPAQALVQLIHRQAEGGQELGKKGARLRQVHGLDLGEYGLARARELVVAGRN